MDLDNIKKTWQQTEIKTTVDEQKIQRMLDNQGRGAFENLLKYEKLFLKIIFGCILFDALFFWINLWLGIAYAILILAAFPWQFYKIDYLNKIDLSTMSILEVSKRITHYKKFILYEIAIGFLILILFYVFYVFYVMPQTFPKLPIMHNMLFLLINFLIMLIFTIGVLLLIYKKVYFNNIKKIQETASEIKEFEKEN